MSKRLQVILEDTEYREIQRMARSRHVTLAQWVRDALRTARRHEPLGDAGRKLAVVRAATLHSFPTGDIEQIMSEIEHGYSGAAV